ncbi:hypothetical protein MTO96_050982 [Rhipicephalus appendiculatus]
MSCSGLAPPTPFLLSPGRPVVPWEQWHGMFETYLLTSGATEFSPERRRAILINCLRIEGQRIFNTPPATAAPTATASAEKFDAGTTPTASADKPDATGTPTAPNVYDVAVAELRQHFALLLSQLLRCQCHNILPCTKLHPVMCSLSLCRRSQLPVNQPGDRSENGDLMHC